MRVGTAIGILALVPLALAACDSLTAPIGEVNGCSRVQAIDIGDSKRTALTENDCTLISDFPVDYFAFETDGGEVTITVTPVQGDAFTPFLGLLDEDGEGIAEEYGSGENPVTLTEELEAGAYAIAVASTSGFGTYDLSIE